MGKKYGYADNLANVKLSDMGDAVRIAEDEELAEVLSRIKSSPAWDSSPHYRIVSEEIHYRRMCRIAASNPEATEGWLSN